MSFRIHITGACGAGTSTLGRALATRLGIPQIESDDLMWEPTDPPYQRLRDRAARQPLLIAATEAEAWVLSGSINSWGDVAVPRFQLVVLLSAPTEIRLERLRKRELERFGAEALAPGGVMHQNHVEFIDYAAKYDTGGLDIRSGALHEAWIATLPCPVLRLDGLMPTEKQVERVLEALTGS
jgi:adenylate kinase family enzyme